MFDSPASGDEQSTPPPFFFPSAAFVVKNVERKVDFGPELGTERIYSKWSHAYFERLKFPFAASQGPMI